MYLVEALKYNVPAFHEDRLTQIVAATFNESAYFRKLFLSFLRVPLKGNLLARTQVVSENAPSRPDMVILENDRPYILIESKIEAKSDRQQQENHLGVRAPYNFLIARDPISIDRVERNFKKLTWYDFFSFLLNSSRRTKSPVDIFLIEKLISFGRASKMLLPDRILKSDFDSSNVFMTQMRLQKSPLYLFERRNPFQSLDTISHFLERVLIRVKDDPEIGQLIRPFTRRLRVGTTSYQETRNKISFEKNVTRKRELQLKTDTITLEKEIRLKRPVGEFHHLYVRASFVPCFKNQEIIKSTLEDLGRMDLDKISYQCEIESGLSDAKGDWEPSDGVCFGDTEELGFEEFYKEAVKNWKKKLLLSSKRTSRKNI